MIAASFRASVLVLASVLASVLLVLSTCALAATVGAGGAYFLGAAAGYSVAFLTSSTFLAAGAGS